MVVVTLRGPRIRAPLNVIETLIRGHFKRPPGAASGRNTKLEEQRGTSIAIPSGSDLDCVGIAPLPTVPTVGPFESFIRNSTFVSQYHAVQFAHDHEAFSKLWNHNCRPYAYERWRWCHWWGVAAPKFFLRTTYKLPFRKETWSVTGFRVRWMVTRGRAGLAGRSV
jgi:hypothetical protein